MRTAAPADDNWEILRRRQRMNAAPPASKAGDIFTIPLEDGKVASIPYPMSDQTWDLFMQTLTLWKPRLVAATENTPDA